MSNKTNSEVLDQLLFGNNLDNETSRDLMKRWLNNEISDVQTGAFLSALRAKGVTGLELSSMAEEQIDHNARLIKPGMTFKEFIEKSWLLPEEYYGNRYSCMVHGIGLCDEWPQIKYPTDGGEQGGMFEKNMTITVESYIGKVGGKEGVKLEQQYLVGQNGLELMSHHPLEKI